MKEEYQTNKRPFNEWKLTPFNKELFEDTEPEGERELNDWAKGLGWGILLGAIATNIVYLLILSL